MAKLSAGQVYKLALDAGFTTSEARVMTTIAYYESGWETTVVNDKPPDLSYGLWQINMLGAKGPERRKALGLSRNEELLNPVVNARAAYYVYKPSSKGGLGQGFNAWSVYLHRATNSGWSRTSLEAGRAKPEDLKGGGVDLGEYASDAVKTAIGSTVDPFGILPGVPDGPLGWLSDKLDPFDAVQGYIKENAIRGVYFVSGSVLIITGLTIFALQGAKKSTDSLGLTSSDNSIAKETVQFGEKYARAKNAVLNRASRGMDDGSITARREARAQRIAENAAKRKADAEAVLERKASRMSAKETAAAEKEAARIAREADKPRRMEESVKKRLEYEKNLLETKRRLKAEEVQKKIDLHNKIKLQEKTKASLAPYRQESARKAAATRAAKKVSEKVPQL